MAKKKKAKRKANPKKRTAARRKTNPKKRTAARRKSNPKRRTAARRKSNPKRRTAARRKSNPTRRAPKAARRRKNGRRTRRKNPGWGNLEVGFMALAAGTGAALLSSWINDAPLGNRGPVAQNGTLLLEGAIATYFIESPAILGGVLVGLFLVPIAKFVYNAAPALANPRPMGLPMAPAAAAAAPAVVVVNPDGSTTVAAPATMSALHRGNIGYLNAMDARYGARAIGALHRGVGALHRGVGALHRPAMGMGALHRGSTMGAVTISRSAHANHHARTART
jgi:hypothetical protein